VRSEYYSDEFLAWNGMNPSDTLWLLIVNFALVYAFRQDQENGETGTEKDKSA
jgi:hypothetical protein